MNALHAGNIIAFHVQSQQPEGIRIWLKADDSGHWPTSLPLKYGDTNVGSAVDDDWVRSTEFEE